MCSRIGFTHAFALSVLMAVAHVAEATGPTPAHLVLKKGDALGGSVVSRLNAPFTDGNGKVGFLGVLTDQRGFIWYDNGPIFYTDEAMSATLQPSEGTIGIGNGGEFAFSPFISTTSGMSDGIWTNNGLSIQGGGYQAPDLPTGYSTSFSSRPQMTDDGTAYWVSGFNETGGTSTDGRVLYKQTQGSTPEVVFGSGATVQGETVAAGSAGIDLDYCFSGNGANHIQVLQMETGSIDNDDRLCVNGLIVAGETQATGDGTNWVGFECVSINNDGDYLFSGNTTGPSAIDTYLAYNGNIALREGDTVDGLTLGRAVHALSINDLGQAAFIWRSSSSRTLFAGDASSLGSSVALLSVGDDIDIDGDDTGDYVITDFKANGGTGPGIDLAEDGFVYVEVDMQPATGGSTVEGIVRVATPEPSSLILLMVGGSLALLRRR